MVLSSNNSYNNSDIYSWLVTQLPFLITFLFVLLLERLRIDTFFPKPPLPLVLVKKGNKWGRGWGKDFPSWKTRQTPSSLAAPLPGHLLSLHLFPNFGMLPFEKRRPGARPGILKPWEKGQKTDTAAQWPHILSCWANLEFTTSKTSTCTRQLNAFFIKQLKFSVTCSFML